MNISEMFSTTGGILFYGGIIGIVFSILITLVFIPVFKTEKKRVIKRIEKDYKNK